MKTYEQFPIGSTVRLSKDSNHTCPKERDNHRTARIVGHLRSIGEGAVLTDRDLRGCRYWNISDLELVE